VAATCWLAASTLLAACSGGVSSTNTSSSVTASQYTVGGTTSGLSGSGLLLQNNAGDTLAVSSDGAFKFPTPLVAGDAYAVTVFAQPSAPTQTCAVTNGSGTITAGNVTSITVNCATKTTSADTIGGAVAGLLGTGLVLQDNGGDNLAVAANGAFTFPSTLPNGVPYAVSVLSPPVNPYQDCAITHGVGTTGASDVTNVAVSCKTNPNPTYPIGGTVTGLSGTLVLQDNGRDDITISKNGPFQFPLGIPSGSAYRVTAHTVTGQQSQACTFANASGVVAAGAVDDVTITCTPNVVIAATVTNLVGGGLVLQDNGGDDLAVAGNGTVTFATAVPSGARFDVTVLSQPSSGQQTCVVTNGSGTAQIGATSTIAVNCTNTGSGLTQTYTLGGTLQNLAGGSVLLQDGAGAALLLSANGAFQFPTALASGTSYSVAVTAQPISPSQSCTVTNGTGVIGTSNVTTIVVACVKNAFSVNVAVTGLSGSGLVLQDNGGNNLAIPANGSFTFSQPIASGGTYSVAILTPPAGPSETCTTQPAAGTITNANVTVNLTCVINSYAIGGQVTGYTPPPTARGALVLLDNGGNALPVNGNGGFSFSALIASGSGYSVTVGAQPTLPQPQNCSVANGSGTVGAGNVTNVAVNCTNVYTVSVSVTGLITNSEGAVPTGLTLLDNNAGAPLAVTGNGSFTFPLALPPGAAYAVTIATQPTGTGINGQPVAYACAVSSGTGTITNANVTSVSVACSVIGAYLYVTNGGDNSVSGFAIDANTGALQPLTGIVAPPGQPNAEIATTGLTQPSAIIAGCPLSSPTLGTLYVANSPATDGSSGYIGAYTVDASGNFVSNGTANLTNQAIPTFLDYDFGALCLPNTGNALLALAPAASEAFSFAPSATGSLSAVAGGPLATAPNTVPVASAFVVNLPSTIAETSGFNVQYILGQGFQTNGLYAYAVSAAGALSLLTPGGNDQNPALLGSTSTPTALATTVISFSGDCEQSCIESQSFAYMATVTPVIDTGTVNAIYGVQIDPQTGAPFGSAPTPLETLSGPTTSALISVPTINSDTLQALTVQTPRVLIAAEPNGENSSIVSFVVSVSVSGEIRGEISSGQFPGDLSAGSSAATGTNPVAMTYALLNGVYYLYVVNQGSNDVWVYTVDTIAGGLTPLGRYAVGVGPTSAAVPL
jgi:hypothetical protein